MSTFKERGTITSVSQLLDSIKQETEGWRHRWFRGQQDDWSLKPSIFRDTYNERSMCNEFRNKAPGFCVDMDFSRHDQWLFLMQHHGAPTRLLDWTESALVALYFAVADMMFNNNNFTTPVVWILNPDQMNKYSVGMGGILLSMATSKGVSAGFNNCKLAFGAAFPARQNADNIAEDKDSLGNIKPLSSINPVAISTTYSDPRMVAQKSCFTVHGSSPDALESCFSGNESSFLIKYKIDTDSLNSLNSELMLMGITHSTIFPDLDGLCKDLKTTHRKI